MDTEEKLQDEKLDYELIMAELETIVEKIETPDLPLKEIEPLLKRAKALIALARKVLEGYKSDFEKVLEQ